MVEHHDAAAYGELWERQHRDAHEWHATWADVAPLVAPYLLTHQRQAGSAAPLVVDIGCGSSTMGAELAQALGGAAAQLLAVDVAAGVIEAAQHQHRHQQLRHVLSCPAGFVQADCRRLPLPPGCATCLLDKVRRPHAQLQRRGRGPSRARSAGPHRSMRRGHSTRCGATGTRRPC